MTWFEQVDWTPFYGNVTDVMPPNAPKARDKILDMHMSVDADHPGDNKVAN
jgi:hypothetical protein